MGGVLIELLIGCTFIQISYQCINPYHLTKVTQLKNAVPADEQVLRFDVSVDDVSLVAPRHGLAQLIRQTPHSLKRHAVGLGLQHFQHVLDK